MKTSNPYILCFILFFASELVFLHIKSIYGIYDQNDILQYISQKNENKTTTMDQIRNFYVSNVTVELPSFKIETPLFKAIEMILLMMGITFFILEILKTLFPPSLKNPKITSTK
jgi:hypothetical protein